VSVPGARPAWSGVRRLRDAAQRAKERAGTDGGREPGERPVTATQVATPDDLAETAASIELLRSLRRSPFRFAFTAALGVGVAYLLYTALVSAQEVLILILVSAILAIGLHPLVIRLERLGMRRGAALALVFLGVAAFFTAFGFAVVPPIVNEVKSFIDAAPGYLQDLRRNRTFHRLDDRYHVLDKLQQVAVREAKDPQVVGGVWGVGKALFSAVFNGITVLILTLYFVSSFERIKGLVYRLVPASRRPRVTVLGEDILNRVGGFVSGAFTIAFIAGATSLIWLLALGVKYAWALAMIVAILDLIPLVGATVGATVATAVAFFHSIPIGIATALFFLLYQQIENYLIYPRVMKRSVDISPAAAIVGVLIGGALLGVVGALIAIPICAAIQLILNEVVLPRQDST
jgi:predicted PurR-regulated permease PerM